MIAAALGFKSRRAIISESVGYIEDTFEAIAADSHLAESKGVELDADRAVEPEAKSLSDALAVNPAPSVIYVHWFPSCHFMILRLRITRRCEKYLLTLISQGHFGCSKPFLLVIPFVPIRRNNHSEKYG